MTTFSTPKVADMLGITRQRVVQLIRAGRLTATRGPYGAYLITREDLSSYLALDRSPGNHSRSEKSK